MSSTFAMPVHPSASLPRQHYLIEKPAGVPQRIAAANCVFSRPYKRCGNRGFSQILRKGFVNNTHGYEVLALLQAGQCADMFDEDQPAGADRAAQPRSKAVRSHPPRRLDIERRCGHPRWHPDWDPLRREASFYGFYRMRRPQQVIAADERVPVLLHRQQRHEMRSAIVEAHAPLCSPHRIGKRSAARDNHHAAGTRRERSDPIGQYC